MKHSKQCPKCHSLRIGHLAVQPDFGGEHEKLAGRPAAFIHKYRVGLDPVAIGSLEAYVCTACGYHETYVASPDKVPWNQLTGFRMINPEPKPDGPYR